jgi:hypothetical protein
MKLLILVCLLFSGTAFAECFRFTDKKTVDKLGGVYLFAGNKYYPATFFCVGPVKGIGGSKYISMQIFNETLSKTEPIMGLAVAESTGRCAPPALCKGYRGLSGSAFGYNLHKDVIPTLDFTVNVTRSPIGYTGTFTDVPNSISYEIMSFPKP